MQEVNTRSEEIQEILSDVPSWITRWGVTTIFIILFLAFIASWFIKYPNTVEGEVVVTTEVPPAYMVARASGKIRLFVKEKQTVGKDERLCLIENAASPDDVFYLMEALESIRPQIYNEVFRAPEGIRENLQVGEIQESYLHFIKAIKDYRRYSKYDYREKQIVSLADELGILNSLNMQQTTESRIMSEELSLGKKTLDRDSILWKQGVLPDLTYEGSKSTFLRLKRSYESMRSNTLNNAIQMARLSSQVNVLKIEQEENSEMLKNEIINSYKQCTNTIQSWKDKYLLTSPIKGEVSFFNAFWANNQNVTTGEEVVAVIPESHRIIGKVKTPIAGSGNVKVGQRVNIIFYNYPSNEYGKVYSRIESISRLPKDSYYEVTVIFPEGLTSSYKRELQFKQHMEGQAKIITNDLRLIERIFNKLRKIFERANNG